MFIWSIDVGHRNMGLAILEVPNNVGEMLILPVSKKKKKCDSENNNATNNVHHPAWENVVIKKLDTVSAWSDKKVTNVNKRPLYEICCQVHKLLRFLLNEKFSHLQPGLVMIEQQPTRGVKNRVLQFFIHGFFLGKEIAGVQQVNSRLKMSDLVLKPASFASCFSHCPGAENAKNFNYRERKQAAVQAAQCWHSFLKTECSAPSKPDESDALLQTLAVLAQAWETK